MRRQCSLLQVTVTLSQHVKQTKLASGRLDRPKLTNVKDAPSTACLEFRMWSFENSPKLRDRKTWKHPRNPQKMHHLPCPLHFERCTGHSFANLKCNGTNEKECTILLLLSEPFLGTWLHPTPPTTPFRRLACQDRPSSWCAQNWSWNVETWHCPLKVQFQALDIALAGSRCNVLHPSPWQSCFARRQSELQPWLHAHRTGIGYPESRKK